MPQPVQVRSATLADADAIAAIYGWHVLHGAATFEVDPPTAADMAVRVSTVQSRGCPWLVAELDGAVAGYAYYAPFHTRFAYRFTCETSIYVAHDRVGQGMGRALLEALIGQARAEAYRQMIAVIGDAGNAASIGLHAAFGFFHAGLLAKVGYKFDRWIDVVYMQLDLGETVA